MEVKITEKASEYLKKELDDKGNGKSVRVFVSGIGWGGPSYGVALDEQRDSDNLYNVDGVSVLFDKESSEYTKGFEIDYRKSVFGSRLIVSELYGSGGTCC